MTEPVDSAAREQAVHARGSVLVQAPAGSGKTTLLAQRYLRLLSEVEAPESILALTFTRRAAQEMRERVLQALRAAECAECPATMSALSWTLGRAARRRMAALGLDLEQHPSRLRIETIDAFNAWLAGQLPVTAGAGSRLTLIDNARPLYEEAARRTLAHDQTDVFGHAVDQVLAFDDQRWRSLVRLISQLLPHRDRWLPLLAGRLQGAAALDASQLRRVRRQLDEDLGFLVSRALRAADDALGAERREALTALLHAAARRGDPPALAAWRDSDSMLRAEADDLARWRSVAAVLLTQEPAFRKQLTKNEGFPPRCADKAALLDLIAELDREPGALRLLAEIRSLPEAVYDDAQWERVREVAQVLVLAAAQLDQVFRETGAVDFPAVSMAALRALGGPDAPTDLNLRLDYRLQHILVDEFQDTSGAQLELVARLTAGWQRGDGRSIFCVGDPMQSIYGFRQAEVRAFLELAEEGVGDVRFEVGRLRTNFRSAQPLVDWVNGCFSRILPRVDDRARGAIAYRPSEAMTAGPADADAGVSLRGFAGRREEADAIAVWIAAQCARHPDWRIVILVRAKAHAREIAGGLRAHGIPFRAIDMQPLKDRPAVRDLVMLICALLHWADRIAWLALLRAPWCGLLLTDLLELARHGPVVWEALLEDDVLAALTTDGRARCQRLRGVLTQVFRVRNQSSVTRWVEQAWLALGGAACTGPEDLESACAVFARLRELEERGLPDAAELAQAFDDLYAEPGAAASVEIMTIHKAKGLEFDAVVVPALDRAIPGNRDHLLLSHEFAREGRDGMVMAARPGIGADSDRLFEFLRHQARDAASLEAERLLYVACTRAKWQLHLSAVVGRGDATAEAGGADADDQGGHSRLGAARADLPAAGQAGASPAATSPAPWTPRTGSLLAVLWPVLAGEFTLGNSPPAGAVPAAAGDGQLPQGEGVPLRRVPSDWTPPLPGVATPGVATPGVPTPGVTTPLTPTGRYDTPVFDWAGETARRVGSLVHAELHGMRLEDVDPTAIRARGARYHRLLALHGVPDDRLGEAGARVMAALVAVHEDPRGRWILQAGYRDDLREHALSAHMNGEVVRVVFDRSFVDAGTRWVIDYKTSHHAGGNLDEFLDREVERYTAQLARYAHLARKLGPEPVRVGLYFPLLRAWREWAP